MRILQKIDAALVKFLKLLGFYKHKAKEQTLYVSKDNGRTWREMVCVEPESANQTENNSSGE
jgi:hypothetical protein